MTSTVFKLASIHLFRTLIADVLYFPFWWLTRGLKKAVFMGYRWMHAFAHRYALFVLAKNLFRPMFGQRDWQGRLISFFVRFFQLLFLSAIWLIWCAITLTVTLCIIALPVFIVWGILYQLAVVSHPLFYWWL